ncbi:MAG TPA: hypothetical protein PK411_06290 [Mesotoga infera]|uniref:Uncharacterized protein n=1 Tax=Mesotoga infera TaxID=1236046 RepID=A0A7Z7LH85_9BACT|nr:hypothetical protein [Mesotoga infera]HRR44164.1 hypothetical protein [Mesotoga sp.]SSC13866.1 conserved protein of unknown function [Mesotoga infera]HOI34891.1 hypothetical protein [Mesotoga infera]HPD37938.1 hypothetical protein [Mesotoga infera]HRV01391.1 hypothetical protein [Mesotoga sp.]
MDNERLVRVMDREIPIEELRVEEKMELKEYAKALMIFREKCCYKPSNQSRDRVIAKIKKMKTKPYRMLGTVVACMIVGFFSVNFFTNNTILVKRKGDLYQLANVLGYSSGLNERLKVNLLATVDTQNRNSVAMMESEMERSLGFLSSRPEQNNFEVSGINTTY